MGLMGCQITFLITGYISDFLPLVQSVNIFEFHIKAFDDLISNIQCHYVMQIFMENSVGLPLNFDLYDFNKPCFYDLSVVDTWLPVKNIDYQTIKKH